MMKQRLGPGGWPGIARTVTSPPFIAALLLLLLNDFVLKREFSNAATGKLSDVAGLWLFPVFFAAIFPRRRDMLYILTGVGFVFWKSPLSELLIVSWNATPLFDIGRVVDWTDLVALAVLPPAYLWSQTTRGVAGRRAFLAAPLAGLSVVAFVATTCEPDVIREETFDPAEQVYVFAVPKSELVDKLDEVDQLDRHYAEPATPMVSFTYDVRLKDVSGCQGPYEHLDFRADFIDTDRGRSEVRLRAALLACDDNFQAAALRTIFEREVIAKLRAD